MKYSKNFINLETLSANILLGAALLAFILSNTPGNLFYQNLFVTHTLHFANLNFAVNLHFIVNEILMTLFFFVVALEIKFEIVMGSLNSWPRASLPIIAAIGGMIMPALIFLAINISAAHNLQGWAIPTATDIAFSLGVLSLLGSRAIPSLKAFLMSLAILDDLLAIIIIAVFYSNHLSVIFLILALLGICMFLILNLLNIQNLILYFIVGLYLWICFYLGGIHPTLAGVVLALAIPLQNHVKKNVSQNLKEIIHPYVAFIVLPLFAFANAGVPLKGLTINSIDYRLLLGICLGLFIGKQLGIFSSCWLAVKTGVAKLPLHANWRDLYGVALLCGIGFTISLFIGTLAFANQTDLTNTMKLGVLLGSTLSGITGYLFLYLAAKRRGNSF